MEQTPIVTIDGPSGAGKGTISLMVARELKWHFLDSGAIYRVLAVATLHHGMDPSDEDAIVPLASSLDVNFKSTDAGEPQVILEGEDVTYTIRTENVGAVASKVASLPGCGKLYCVGNGHSKHSQAWSLTAVIWARWSFQKPKRNCF